ncbi:hypothetical protein BpHYR1_033171 [Brachionus plicatilis]|uniref:Uncharacterized protein n=1 Tax=Brachionus plicatilis TaxID=10195 RepID=A0A3M7QMA5_BRAPC|nr:hypothetical protein BpHYR1_033171 [Brachionus plicatilis]
MYSDCIPIFYSVPSIVKSFKYWNHYYLFEKKNYLLKCLSIFPKDFYQICLPWNQNFLFYHSALFFHTDNFHQPSQQLSYHSHVSFVSLQLYKHLQKILFNI